MSSDYKIKCRTCLNRCTTYYKSVDDVEECYNILDMLDSIVPHIAIRSSTQYSSLVCQICVEKLLNSYKFQQMCIKSNNILQNILPITIIKDEEIDQNIVDPLGNHNIKYEDSAKKLDEEINSLHNRSSGNDNVNISISQAQFNMNETVTRNCSKEDEIPQNSLRNVQSFQCNYCSKTFEKQVSLASHSRVHKIKDLQKNNTKPNESDFKKALIMSATLQEKETDLKTINKECIDNSLQTHNETINLNNALDIESRESKFNDSTDTGHATLPNHKNEGNERTYQCSYCSKTFKKQVSLASHCRTHRIKELPKNKTKMIESDSDESSDLPVYLEEGKGDHITEKEDIDNGQQIHNEATKSTNKDRFPCKLCSKTFAYPSDLSRHNSNVHFKAYECKICKHRFSKEKALEAHLLKHNTESVCYKCKVCDLSFVTNMHLFYHFKNQHSDSDKHKCNYCKKTFLLQTSLLKHTQYYHKSEESLQCQICKLNVEHMHQLKKHMLSHKTYLCPHCGKSFKGPSNYGQHILRHEGQQNHQCPDCPRRFNNKNDLLKHAITHSTAKPYVCDICGSKFNQTQTMRKHKKFVHGAERRYKCNQCSMTFNRLYTLKRHMFTHTGEKPHKCKYCERAYASSGDLTKHLRTHVGEKTYICDQCPESFKYQVELRNHQFQHYKMDQKREHTMPEEAEQHHEKSKEKQQEKETFGQ